MKGGYFFIDGVFNIVWHTRRIFKRFLGGVDELFSGIVSVDQIFFLLVLRGVDFRILLHFLNLRFRQTGTGLYPDGLFFAGSFVLGLDVKNTVGIDIESHFYLGRAARRRSNTVENKPAERFVVRRHSPLALDNVNFNRGLIISGSGENLRLRRGNSGIFLDQFGSYGAHSFDTE